MIEVYDLSTIFLTLSEVVWLGSSEEARLLSCGSLPDNLVCGARDLEENVWSSSSENTTHFDLFYLFKLISTKTLPNNIKIPTLYIETGI